MKVHEKRADNLDSAESASIEEIKRDLPALEGSGFHTDYNEINVGEAIAPGFACPSPPVSAICDYTPTKVVSISEEDGNWRLVLRNRWDQEVILGPKFNFVSTRRLPDPAKDNR